MPSIHVTTFIAAPIERVFDLSRHVAVYKRIFQGRHRELSSTASSNFIALGETVSVNGKIGGKHRITTLKFTDVEKPATIVETQIKGDLENFTNVHYFKPAENGTILINIIEYGSPRDIIGRIIGKYYLRNYLEGLIHKKNEIIRNYAETERWRAILT